MSAPPATKPRLNNSLKVGAAVGGVVLFGGLLTSSLITLNIVTRHADYAFRPGATQPRSTDRQPDNPPDTTGPGITDDDDPGPFKAATVFMREVRARRFEKAWDQGTSLFKKDESAKDFRERLESDKVFKQHNTFKMTRSNEATKPGLTRYEVTFGGPGGEGRYNLDVRREDDSWRVDSFARD
jgi:hypothetical protein